MKKSKESLPDRVNKGTVPVLERLNELDKDQLHAVLATDSEGQPYTSMIAYAFIPDKKGIIFFTPRKTQKYSDFVIARGRALARFGRGDRSVELRTSVAGLRETAGRAGLNVALPALDAALRGIESAPTDPSHAGAGDASAA